MSNDNSKEKGVSRISYMPLVTFAVSLVFLVSAHVLSDNHTRLVGGVLFVAQLLLVFTAAFALSEWHFFKRNTQLRKSHQTNLQRIKAIEKKSDELKVALDAHAIVAVTNRQGVITDVNDKFCEISQYSREELIGQTHRVINSGFHPPEFFKELWRTITSGEVWSGDVCNRAKDGSLYWVQSTIVPLIANNGKPEQFIAIRADITVRKEMEVKMHNMAQHDALTGLPNRRQLMDRLSYEISSKKEQPNYSAFVLLDLDHFKEVNDTLGHVTGDELLRQVGERLDRSVRQTDTVARFGGDEFAVILEGVGVELDKAVANVKSACHIIRSTLLDSYLLDGQVIKIASSIGIVLFNSDEDTSIELMKQADIAMYKAKREGRNQICFFEPELQAEATESALLIRDLRQALANKELAVYYQPIVGVQQNIVGAEAVLRWFHPTRGKVSPERFIPLAEKSSLILSIGEWVLKKACLQLAEWSEDPLRKHLVIAVNISARQVSQVDFVERVKDMLVRTGARAERLKLELTESALQDNISSTINKMRALREVGVGFSLDDFGTGYSSLSYLKRLPIEQLKIDKSFINDILDNNISSGIVRTIIRLEENLAIGVIAEGVESKEQLDWLIGYGCKFFQGYFFSRPVSVSLLNALLEKSP